MRTRHAVSLGRVVVLLASAAAASGCSFVRYLEAENTTPVPLNDVLHSLQTDLSRTHPLTLSDIQVPLTDAQGNEKPEVTSFRNEIANLQCYDIDPNTKTPAPEQRKRNPLILVVTGPLQLTVQGQFSTQGTITVTVPPSAAGQIARQAQQQIMMPTTLVPLANLPVFFLGQQMANVQNVGLISTLAPNVKSELTDEEAHQVTEYVARSLKSMSALQAIILSAQKTFDTDQEKYCRNRDNGKGEPINQPAVNLPFE